MAEDYRNQATAYLNWKVSVSVLQHFGAGSKSSSVKIQGVERNRLAAGACVKMRGSVSDVKAAMEAALDVARPLTKIVSHTVIASPSEDTEKAIAMTINKQVFVQLSVVHMRRVLFCEEIREGKEREIR